MTGVSYQTKNYTDEQKLEYGRKFNQEQSELYQLISKLFIVVIRKKLKMIVENPNTQPHYLTHYFPIKPSLIDSDRRVLGDKYMKPTQYWFVNVEPKNNYIKRDRSFEFGKKVTVNHVSDWNNCGITRSLIEPKYAENFIKKYILEVDT